MENERLTHELGSTEINQPEEVINEKIISADTNDGIDDSEVDTSESGHLNNSFSEEVKSETDPPPEEVEQQEDPTDAKNAKEQPQQDQSIEEPDPEKDNKSEDPLPERNKKEKSVVANDTPADGEEVAEIDYSTYSREQLLKVVRDLSHEDDVVTAGNELKRIKPFFDKYEEVLRAEALSKFVADGGEKDDFSYQPDEVSREFDANNQLIRDKRHKHFKNVERQKEENLNTKNLILEELRKLVDGEETVTSLKVIKEIQQRWRNTGPIPRQFNRTLWANYNALLDRFYDNRSIYFELKELDRKKNNEAKIEICEKAEALALDDNLQRAIQELNLLHDEFKHIGPVPVEYQEEIWIRFKAASDCIYARRKDYVHDLKEQLNENLKAKITLCDKIEAFKSFNSESLSEWNEKTRELIAIQKEWEEVGGLPRDKAKTVNKRFWASFKNFFNRKNRFFKSLEGQKDENLKLKEDLVKKAEELKESTDFNNTADEFKNLQKQWRDIGPVPDKSRNEIYKRFKSACDEFFERKRASVKELEKEFDVNLKRKQEICDQLEEIGKSDRIDLDMIEALQDQYSDIGFVPRSNLKKMNQRYDEVLDLLTGGLEESDLDNKEQLILEIRIRKMKGKPGSNKSLQKQENNLRRQISTIENNISTWRNNLEFFRDSKTADKFKKEFDGKIDAASQELKQLKKQLRMLETTS